MLIGCLSDRGGDTAGRAGSARGGQDCSILGRARGQYDADLPRDLAGHTVVVGYGRVGQTIGKLLDAQELPHVGIDIDAELVRRFRNTGARCQPT